ncbi:PAS domain S-box protein [Spirochaetota bacterium]
MKKQIKKTILLVEDDVLIAMAEKKSLETYGYSIIITHTGQEAIETVKSTPEINLILMDIDLGKGIDGTQTAEIILKNHDLPIVFLSSHTEPEIVEKTENITSYGYVVKDSNLTVLDASIKMAFKLFEADKKIKKSDDRFRLINNASFDQIYSYDLDNRFTSANQQLCENLKRTEAEIIGKTYWEFGFPEAQCLEWDELHRQVYANGSLVKTVSTPMPDGTIQYFQVNLSVLRDDSGTVIGITGVNRNITDQKQFELKLKENEEKYRMLFERVGDSIFIFDPETFNILEANSATSKMYGYDKDELIGMSCLRFSAEVDKSKSSSQEARKEGKVTVVYRHHKTKNGDDLFVDLDAYKGIVNEKEVMFAVSKNVTRHKKAEEEIHRQLQEKETLLKEVHHRIKNNIASIEGLLSLQLQSISNPEAVSILEDTIIQVQGMRILYEKLLISKDFQEVSIKDYIEALIDAIVTVNHESGKVTVEKQIEDFDLNTKIIIPVGIIINELITNAFKYAFRGRDSGHISISFHKIKNNLKLTIQDNGHGVDERINLNKSPGFGLEIVKMLAEQLGGTFTIKDQNGTICILEFEI